LATNFLFSVQYKADRKQNIVFSVALLNGAKIKISLHYWILTRFNQGHFKSFGLYLCTFVIHVTLSKGPDHLAPGLGHPGRF
jgi:hypothetical protein